MKIPLVEDEKEWAEIIQKCFRANGIQVMWYENGEEILKAIRADEEDQYKAVLIDWKLPGISGPEIARRIKTIKPYLRMFAITNEDNINKAVRISTECGFDGFLVKKSLNDKRELGPFIEGIKAAVKEVEEVLICRPFSNKNEHKVAYLVLRNSREWLKIEESISETSNTMYREGSFQRTRTLRDCLPTKSSGHLLIENILAARRVILAEILNNRGKLHSVEKAVGYEDQEGLEYEDLHKMYDTAFKNYCSELGLKPDEFRNTGKGLLPEEEKWLRKWCEENNVLFRFPLT